MTSHRAGRMPLEDDRARVRAVLATPDGHTLTHDRVAELADVSNYMVRAVRRDLGLLGGVGRKYKPRAATTPKAAPAPTLVASPLDPQQAELLTRIYDVALGGTNTLRLLEIRGLLKSRVGQQLREAAVIATGKAGAA